MKIFANSAANFVLMVAACIGFAACSDDNDESGGEGIPTSGVVNPSNVFTGLAPKSVAGTSITHNSEGLVSEMRTADGKIITFEYPVRSRADKESENVKMTVIDDDVKTEYDMTIGSNGFVSKSYVKVTSGSSKEDEEGDWSFTYDSDGHLTNAKHIYMDVQGDEDYSVTLQWKDGNIVKTFKDDGWDSYTYSYTSSFYPTAIENKGALFLFEDIYPIEIYDFEWVYYAGMLGKGPKNLAVSVFEYDEDTEVTYYVWTLDHNGYPTVFDVRDDDHPGSSTVRFTWN